MQVCPTDDQVELRCGPLHLEEILDVTAGTRLVLEFRVPLNDEDRSRTRPLITIFTGITRQLGNAANYAIISSWTADTTPMRPELVYNRQNWQAETSSSKRQLLIWIGCS